MIADCTTEIPYVNGVIHGTVKDFTGSQLTHTASYKNDVKDGVERHYSSGALFYEIVNAAGERISYKDCEETIVDGRSMKLQGSERKNC